MANLGFIGLGAMGSRIADRLQRAGHSVTVYDRNAKRVEALAAKGAAVARTPAEVAARSEIVLSCVADDAAVEAVLLGPHGELEQVRPGTLVVDLSTVSPVTSRPKRVASRSPFRDAIQARQAMAYASESDQPIRFAGSMLDMASFAAGRRGREVRLVDGNPHYQPYRDWRNI